MDARVYIQYVGFTVAARSRVYNFDVIGAAEAREFTVKVQFEAFRPAALKLQDGPEICYTRLKQELEAETQQSRAEAHLDIGERDIEQYVARHPRLQPGTRKKPRNGDAGAE